MNSNKLLLLNFKYSQKSCVEDVGLSPLLKSDVKEGFDFYKGPSGTDYIIIFVLFNQKFCNKLARFI